MKKFKFRLEKVLQYRKIVKDEKLRELMMRNHILNEENQRLERLEAAALRNIINANQSMSASIVHLAGLYGARIKEEIVRQKLVLIEVKEKAEEAMAEYVEAAKDEEALVTLRNRKKEEYMEYVKKEEEKYLDEFCVQRGNTFIN